MSRALALVFIAACLPALATGCAAHDPGAAGGAEVGPASASLPPGFAARGAGSDPKGSGVFTIRVKVPGGARIGPHWASARRARDGDLGRRVAVGFGDSFDEKAMTRFEAGGFYVNPRESTLRSCFRRRTVVQITAVGPWQVQPAGRAGAYEIARFTCSTMESWRAGSR